MGYWGVGLEDGFGVDFLERRYSKRIYEEGGGVGVCKESLVGVVSSWLVRCIYFRFYKGIDFKRGYFFLRVVYSLSFRVEFWFCVCFLEVVWT